MADFSIASQIGGGQNAFAGGGGANPNTMLQLMQLQQTMALQRAAEQRAQAGEARAQALHGPALTNANQRVQAGGLELESARLGLDEKKENKALEGKLFNWIATQDDPYDVKAIEGLRAKEPKLYTALSAKVQERAKLAAETQEKTVKSLKESFDYLQKAAPVYLSNFDRIKDQATYSKVYEDLRAAQPRLAALIGPEYSPENAGALKTALQSLTTKSTMSLPGGDVVLLDNGKPVGMVDPTQPNGVRMFGPGEAPAAPAQAQPTVAPFAAPAQAPAQPRAAGFGSFGGTIEQIGLQAVPGARVTSGYRDPAKNAAVGGAQNSFHLSDNARDFVPPAGMPMNAFAAQLKAAYEPLGYTVMYGDPGHLDHVHVQPGPAMGGRPQLAQGASIAATDMAAGRPPMGMSPQFNALAPLAPLAAAQIMQPQNAMTQPQPQAPVNLAPGLKTDEAAGPTPPRPQDYPSYGAYVKAMEEHRSEQRKMAEEKRKAAQEIETFKQKEDIKAEAAAKPKPLTPVQEKKLRDDIAADYSSARSTLATMDDVISAVDAMRKIPDSDKDAILGPMDARTPTFRRGSIGAQAKLDNLTGQVTAMGKAAASLSGALGNMAVQEWKIVQDQIASIDPTRLDAKELNKQLDIIEAKAKAAAARTRDAYRRQYAEEFDRFGDRFKLPDDTTSSGKTPSIEDLLKKYGG